MSHLDRAAAAERIKNLRDELWRHRDLYYNKNAPEIGDREYDALEAELAELEAAHPDLATDDSPTRRPGIPLPPSDDPEGLPPVPHSVPMLSMQNTYTDDEVERFTARTRANVQRLGFEDTVEYLVELKIDGVALALRYEEGAFTLAATRGDGKTGENITANAALVGGVPKSVRSGDDLFSLIPGQMEVRGEAYMPRVAFEALRREQEESGTERIFANPRNATAGTLKLKNRPELVKQRGIRAWLYASPTPDAFGVETQEQLLRKLEEMGFAVNPHRTVCQSAEEILAWRDAWEKKRHGLPYETDGLVIKVNRLAHQEALGVGSKSPHWAVAYKFEPERAETTLLDIRVQVGKTGALTPVADLEPVLLAGSTIHHASLHNYSEVERKDIRIGDRVLIEKAGEIIPQVVRSLPEKRTEELPPFRMPSSCPACKGEVSEIRNRPAGLDREIITHVCNNAACPAKRRGMLLHFVSRDCMDIDGFGPAVIDQLLDNGTVKDVADLFSLTLADLEPLERLAEKSARNLLDALATSRQRGLARLLAALGIPHVGTNTANELAQRYDSMDALLAATEDDLKTLQLDTTTSYRTLGRKSAETLFTALQDEDNRKLFDATDPETLIAQLERLRLNGFAEKKYQAVARQFESANALLRAPLEAIARTEMGTATVERTLGEVKAREIRQFLDTPENRRLIERLREAGVDMTSQNVAANTGASGKVFVLTGRLPSDMPRPEAKKLIEAAGGTVSGSISRKVDFLVAGEKAGSKLTKARDLGIRIIDEDEMHRLCQTPDSPD